MSLTFGLAELLLKLEEVKKATSRRERKELNLEGVQVVVEPDNVFVEDHLASIEPPIASTELNKSQSLSASSQNSLSETVNNIIDFVHDANLHISPVLQPSRITPPIQGNNPWSESMLREKEEILNRLSKLEGSCRDRDKIVDQIKIDLEEMSEKANLIMSNNLDTDDKIERLRSDVDKIDRGVKRYIDNRLADIKTQIDKNKILDNKGNLTNPILQNIKEALVKEPPVEPLKEIRSEIESLKVRNKCEEITIASIRDSAIDVKNKLEMSGIENMSHSINNESTGLLSTINSSFHNQKERDLVKDAIDNSAKLIRQIIKVKVSESLELNLIHKCNVDIKKLLHILSLAMIY